MNMINFEEILQTKTCELPLELGNFPINMETLIQILLIILAFIDHLCVDISVGPHYVGD